VVLPSDDRCGRTLSDFGSSSSNPPLLNHYRREGCIFLLFAAQVVVAEITSGSGYLIGGIQHGNGHVATYYTQLLSLSLSLSLSCGQMVSSGRDQRQIEIRVRVIPQRLLSSRSVATREQGRYKLELLSLLLSAHLFALPFSSTPDTTPAINLKQYHEGRNTTMSLLWLIQELMRVEQIRYAEQHPPLYSQIHEPLLPSQRAIHPNIDIIPTTVLTSAESSYNREHIQPQYLQSNG
jgi:hypothetical protein